MAESYPTVLIIGPLPPPEFGVAKATKLMLESTVLSDNLRIVHLDTSDRRGMTNVGVFDSRNTYLALRHSLQLVWILARQRPAVTLLTASQGKFGLFRDGLFVWIARLLRTRIVTYLRGSRYAETQTNEGMLAARVLRRILTSSSRIVVLGDTLAGTALAVYPDAKVAVVPNGCPPAVASDRVGSRNPTHPLLLYLGKLSEAKGIEEAIRATKRVAARVSSLRFVLCGDWQPPAFESRMLGLVRDLGLQSIVSFPGPVSGDEKADLLVRAHVLVVPSHSEGQPWVILEAMSAGLPVVATDTGAISETVADGVTGFVVPVGDCEALASRVAALLTDDDLWRDMSKAAVEHYRERFTVERSHSALADVLCQVARDD